MADSLTLTTMKHHTSPTNTDTKTSTTNTATTISFFKTRKIMAFAYCFTFIFIASAVFLFLNPSGSSSPWLNNFSSIFSHFLPYSSSFSHQPNTTLQLSNNKDNQSLSNDKMGSSQSPQSQPFSARTGSLSQESRNSSLNSTLEFSRKKEFSGKVEGSKESNPNPLLNGSSNINVSNHPVSSQSFMNDSRKDSIVKNQFSLKGQNVSKNGSREGFLVKGRKEDLVEMMSKCNIYKGNWVRDNEYPLYAAGSCPHIDEPFNCFLNGRPENGYEKYRWQPMDCSIPR